MNKLLSSKVLALSMLALAVGESGGMKTRFCEKNETSWQRESVHFMKTRADVKYVSGMEYAENFFSKFGEIKLLYLQLAANYMERQTGIRASREQRRSKQSLLDYFNVNWDVFEPKLWNFYIDNEKMHETFKDQSKA